MTTTYHTPIPSSPPQPANAATINGPLAELDAELVAQDARIDDLEADMPVLSGVSSEFYNGLGAFSVPSGTGSTNGHIVQDEGVDQTQRVKLNFTGSGVSVVDTPSATEVQINAGGVTDHGALTGLTDADHVAGSIAFTDTDKVLGRSSSGAGAGEEIPLTAAGRALIDDVNAAAQRVTLGLDNVEFKNLLINGGFDFFQRIVPSTATAMSDDAYNAPDRFYSLVQGANATINRAAGIGTSPYSCKLTAGGTTYRYGVAQIVEASNSIPMRGKTVISQCILKPVNNAGSGTRKYRIAILEWTGTADVVTSELVADWTSGTFTTAGFFASTTKTLVGTATVTATHNTETVLSVSGTVSASCNNLIVFIWVEDVPTHAADYVLIGEVGLYAGSTAQPWLPRIISAEDINVKRFYEKSFEIDIAPGTAVSENTGKIIQVGHSSAIGAVTFQFKVAKRKVPTLTIYDRAGTPAKVSYYDGSSYQNNGTIAVASSGINGGFILQVIASSTQTLFSWVADAEL